MKFLIVGPGAMGLLFSARLKKMAEQEVFILDYKKERAEYLNKNGIRVEGIKGKFYVQVPVLTKEEVDFCPDFIMIFVKSYSTKQAAQDIKKIVSANTSVITLQNGIGNIEILEEELNKKVYGGVTAEGATLLATGHVRHAGYGKTIIGPSSEGMIKLAEVLSKAGFDTEMKDNIQSFIWGKLLINVGINAITALTRLKNGMLIEIDETKSLMKECLKEAIEVVNKKGISLPYKDPIKETEKVCERTAENVSSMLQDVLSNRLTEIDSINGAIVREAEKLGIKAPINQTLTYLVRTIQKTYQKRVSEK